MNTCSNIKIDMGGTACGKQVKQLQHLNVMEVPHIDALARVPAGTIGIVSADIKNFGLYTALSLAAQKQGIHIQFENTIIDAQRAKPPELPVIDHMHTFTIEPTIKKVKSSKGKHGSNYTPPHKKRKKR